MKRPFFSLIIPCYNTGEKIKRVFDSLVRQEIDKDELEIIVVDDNSTDLSYVDHIKDYDFNIVYSYTDTEVHCPSNTRRKGMEKVTGRWLFFCDHDDYFEDNALIKVKQYIESVNDHTIYVVSTIMRGYNEDKEEYGETFAHKQAWLHGKWYSVDDLIKPYNVNFKEDLVTHEDIYFNSLVLSHLFRLNTDWDYLDVYTYRWIDEPTSITRKERTDRGYLFENFEDYLVSAGEPFWNYAKETNEFVFVNQIMMTILHAYFYYEIATYYNSAKEYLDVLYSIERYVKRVVEELEISPDRIIDFVYADPYKYRKVQEDCSIFGGLFICKTSFKDFIYRVSYGGI